MYVCVCWFTVSGLVPVGTQYPHAYTLVVWCSAAGLVNVGAMTEQTPLHVQHMGDAYKITL